MIELINFFSDENESNYFEINSSNFCGRERIVENGTMRRGSVEGDEVSWKRQPIKVTVLRNRSTSLLSLPISPYFCKPWSS